MPDPHALLEIDLDAIAANWALLRARHGADTAAVLKADAYGLGAARVAPRLLQAGCRHFFVAHPDEAHALRPLLPGAMLAVLNGLWPGEAAALAEDDILPVLGQLDEIEAWQREARRRGTTLPALLHVDTGMNRLGLDARELDRLAAEPGRLDGIALRYVMTHLGAAELPHDPMNERQRVRFAQACDRLPAAPRSLANSSGVFLGPAYASDLARPGAALYGLNPTPGRPNPMRPALRLSARVLQLREIPAGTTVGYNGTWTAARPSRIATLSVGYADGFLRSLGNAATARLLPAASGHPDPGGEAGAHPAASAASRTPGPGFDAAPIPLVGRVSMDLTTFDVTDHPQVAVGSRLELIGPAMPPDAVGLAAGTSGYEILTSLAGRYARAYQTL